MELKEKVALVTGGGSGIGLGIAVALAGEGCRIYLCGRNREKLQAAVQAFPEGSTAATRVCDVADREAVVRLVSEIRREAGAVDILVNNAGTNTPKRMMADLDPGDYDRLMAINAGGAFNCLHAVLPGMREKGEGLVFNIVSIAGKRALTFAGLPYSMSKFAQSALGTFVNLEDAEHGIRVTNIYPGEVATPVLDRRPSPPPPEKRALMLQPEDIATCVVTIAKLPARALVSELVITPTYMPWA